MNFHSIVRMWCKIYKPMLDSSTNGNRRFYLTDSSAGVVEMAKGISNKFSPFVLMESDVDGGGSFTKPTRTYPIYFFVHARDMADGDAAAEAKEEAWMHAQNFLSWVYHMHQKEMEENVRGDFASIDVENMGLYVSSVGPLENGWYAVLIQFERMEPLNLCPDPEAYIINPYDYSSYGEYADAYMKALQELTEQEEEAHG
jgi:hypothetical protein